MSATRVGGLLCRALDSFERVLGREHPGTLTSARSLAQCLDALGRPAEAEALHRRALEGLIARVGPEHPDVLTSQKNLAVSLRKAGHPDLAEPYARQCVDASARVLGDANPLAAHRRNNLVITLLMLRHTAEARSLLAANWTSPCPHRTPVTQAIAFLAAMAAMMDGADATDPLGRLKTLLLGPNLEKAPGVGYPWDAGYLLDYLRDALSLDSIDFLRAALAAINDPDLAPDLDRFPLWHDTPALPLNTPWPTTQSEERRPTMLFVPAFQRRRGPLAVHPSRRVTTRPTSRPFVPPFAPAIPSRTRPGPSGPGA